MRRDFVEAGVSCEASVFVCANLRWPSFRSARNLVHFGPVVNPSVVGGSPRNVLPFVGLSCLGFVKLKSNPTGVNKLESRTSGIFQSANICICWGALNLGEAVQDAMLSKSKSKIERDGGTSKRFTRKKATRRVASESTASRPDLASACGAHSIVIGFTYFN